MGDSNTKGLKFAEFGMNPTTRFNGTFGNAMPGKCHTAYTVEDLDPYAGAGFNNIVVHCGINSIRDPSVQTEDDVRSVYVKFKTKVRNIIEVNKRSRVFVSVVLPSKLEDNNRKAKSFNKLVHEDLGRSFKGITIIYGYNKFCDVSGKLAPTLSSEFNKHGAPDYLHLNESGLMVFSKNIKNALFYRKQAARSSTAGRGPGRGEQQGRSYADVTRRRRPERRGGGTNHTPRRSE